MNTDIVLFSFLTFFCSFFFFFFFFLGFINQVNISLIVNDSEAEQCVKALHNSFFESGDLSEDSELILDGEFGNGSAMPRQIESH